LKKEEGSGCQKIPIQDKFIRKWDLFGILTLHSSSNWIKITEGINEPCTKLQLKHHFMPFVLSG